MMEQAVGREELVATTGYFVVEGMTSAQILKIRRTNTRTQKGYHWSPPSWHLS